MIAEQSRKTGPLVTILPGSRTQEVTHNLKWFLKAAAVVQKRVPGFGLRWRRSSRIRRKWRGS